MSNKLFDGDSYKTPASKKRSWVDRLFLNTRGYFLLRFVREIFYNRKLIKKGVYDNDKWAYTSYRMLQLTEDCGGKYDIKGMNNLEKTDGPVVFAANHMSTLETMVLPCIITPVKETTFVVKEKLIHGTFFGLIMRSREPIVVSQTNPRQDMVTVLEQGEKILKSGKSIIIFPEGSRHSTFRPEDFNTLGVKLARRAGVKVIPVALKTDFWGNGKYLKGFGKLDRSKTIFFEIGEPIEVKNREKEAHRETIEFIGNCINKWGEK